MTCFSNLGLIPCMSAFVPLFVLNPFSYHTCSREVFLYFLMYLILSVVVDLEEFIEGNVPGVSIVAYVCTNFDLHRNDYRSKVGMFKIINQYSYNTKVFFYKIRHPFSSPERFWQTPHNQSLV